MRELLSYDAATGVFTWLQSVGKARRGSVAGNIATNSSNRTYRQISIDGRRCYAHSLAVLYVTGQWPTDMLDHRDGDGLNNAFGNIRHATNSLNQQNLKGPQKNNTTGFLGVTRCGIRFKANIRIDRKKYHLGVFATAEDAHARYLQAKREMHPGGLL